MKLIVIDASVVNKFYLDQPDRDQAREVLRLISEDKLEACAPSLITYEILNVVNRLKMSAPEESAVVGAVLQQFQSNIRLVEPDFYQWKKALEISSTGNPKSGYPSFYDAIYHAIAITEKGIFLTADKKHKAKTESFGHICLLQDFL